MIVSTYSIVPTPTTMVSCDIVDGSSDKGNSWLRSWFWVYYYTVKDSAYVWMPLGKFKVLLHGSYPSFHFPREKA